jgi:hypothetical protein
MLDIFYNVNQECDMPKYNVGKKIKLKGGVAKITSLNPNGTYTINWVKPPKGAKKGEIAGTLAADSSLINSFDITDLTIDNSLLGSSKHGDIKLLGHIFSTKIADKWHKVKGSSFYEYGYLFEEFLGKKADNKAAPDFGTIEIKTRRSGSSSMITLTSKTPTNANMLREKFGREATDRQTGEKYLRLNATITANKWTNTKLNPYNFTLKVGNTQLEIWAREKNKTTGEGFKTGFGWNIEDIQNTVETKLQNIAIVSFQTKKSQGSNYVKYDNVEIVDNFTTEKFLNMVNDGSIKVDIRMGAYHSGPKKGQLHDHGTAFRVSHKNLLNS